MKDKELAGLLQSFLHIVSKYSFKVTMTGPNNDNQDNGQWCKAESISFTDDWLHWCICHLVQFVTHIWILGFNIVRLYRQHTLNITYGQAKNLKKIKAPILRTLFTMAMNLIHFAYIWHIASHLRARNLKICEIAEKFFLHSS